MMRLLVLTNNPMRASYRQRIGSFLPYLRQEGWSVAVHKLPSNLLRRWLLFHSARHYDAVLLQKKCLNRFDAAILRKSSKKIIYDFDDAMMYNAKCPRSDSVGHNRLFERTARTANGIIAGNEYLAQHARRFCENVHVVPTGLTVDRYDQAAVKPDDGKIRLVWIGSSATQEYLSRIGTYLDRAAGRDNRLALRIIADVFPSFDTIEVERCPWGVDTHVTDLLACDIGLAPLPDDPFTRGKCGFKILQYFAAGMPVIASPVGVNRDLIEQSGAGILADTPDRWQSAIEELASNASMRKQMGQKAKDFVRQYDLEILAGRFYKIVAEMISA